LVWSEGAVLRNNFMKIEYNGRVCCEFERSKAAKFRIVDQFCLR
jgi:hypothetical protein